MNVRLVKYSRTFLNLSWNWLNDPETKKMTDTADFTREEQERWYDALASREDYKIWGVLAGTTPIGACGLKKITGEDCEYWGYIGEKDFRGQGIGKTIIKLMEKEAGNLCLKSIWAQVLRDNERSLRFFLKMGYIIEVQKQKLLFMRKHL